MTTSLAWPLITAASASSLAGCHLLPQDQKPPDNYAAPAGCYPTPGKTESDSTSAQVVGVRVATGGLLLDTIATSPQPLATANSRAQRRFVQLRDANGADVPIFPFQRYRRPGWIVCGDAPYGPLNGRDSGWWIWTIAIRSPQYKVGDRISLRFVPDESGREDAETMVRPTEWTEFVIGPNRPEGPVNGPGDRN